jgi:predicted metal-dependent phosphoesterase TrpH
MRYDFHVHTSRYSPCSQSTAEAVCRRAVEVGLTGIALTEHDAWWPAAELSQLRARFPSLAIFPGIEHACSEGHFLIFLPDASREDHAVVPRSISDLAAWVHALGGFVIWAHPFRFGRTWFPLWVDRVELDGIEVASSNMDGRSRRLAAEVADRKGWRALQNSDAHHADILGQFGNTILDLLRTNADLIRHLGGR